MVRAAVLLLVCLFVHIRIMRIPERLSARQIANIGACLKVRDMRISVYGNSIEAIAACWRSGYIHFLRFRAFEREAQAITQASNPHIPDRKSVVWGKSVSVRVDIGGRR